ncbi:tyrosine-type recombinase/integrase [Bosea sp. RCC_152_1]|uniref:tyrosine-type recombinase/integrase n=1 Tax=Bosea sp. RCC_152_1 TaxID=3239228 RepID=UPI003524BF94
MDFFGEDADISAINTNRMDDLITHLSVVKKMSGPTINRKLAVMSKVFRYSVKRGVIATFPTIEREEETGGRIRWLSEEEETKLLAKLLSYGKADHVDAISVLIDTGMRPSELYRLKPIDVDLKTGLISIWQTKNDVPRSIPMTSRVKELMKRRLKAGVLFPFDNNWMTPVWNRARKALEMTDDEHFIPYICRHTCASRMVQRGVPLQVVQKWLGHASITMTERYGHLAPDNLRAAVAVLEKQPPVTHG